MTFVAFQVYDKGLTASVEIVVNSMLAATTQDEIARVADVSFGGS